MDAFTLLSEARKYGARAALFGRKVNNAEDQLLMIEWLRRVVDDAIDPAEATRGYHADLAKRGITPIRSLADDLHITAPELEYCPK